MMHRENGQTGIVSEHDSERFVAHKFINVHGSYVARIICKTKRSFTMAFIAYICNLNNFDGYSDIYIYTLKTN